MSECKLTTLSGVVVSLFTGGAFFGAGLAGPTADRFGRRWTITVGCLIFILGGGLQTGARSIKFLWAGRSLAGLGVGFLVMVIPLYQAELAHPSIRGRVTALQQFMLGIGSLVASWVSYGTFGMFDLSSCFLPPSLLLILAQHGQELTASKSDSTPPHNGVSPSASK